MIDEIKKRLNDAKAEAIELKAKSEELKIMVKFNVKLTKDLTDQLEALKKIANANKEGEQTMDNSELQPGD